ncbi:MAG: threonine aldolase family protein [Thermoanaerobaculia bacterium]
MSATSALERASKRLFASDNASGVHPEVLAAIERANRGDAPAYGADELTRRAEERIREVFGQDAAVRFTFGGTGANVIGLAAVTRPTEAVLCAETSHLWRDECGAPEHFTGAKLVPIPTPDGKLTPGLVELYLQDARGVHHARPRVVSVAQATEWGTVYSFDELAALADMAHRHGLLLHVDGARLSNAAAALDLSLARISRDAGVDVLAFGGTKNGLLAAEAVLFLHPEQAIDAPRVQKQAMQLASKMRFVAAQIEALLTDELWLRNARRANAMAARLARRLEPVPGLTLEMPVETNAVFIRVPAERLETLCAATGIPAWEPGRPVLRLMTSFDTTKEEVDALAETVAGIVAA